MPHLERWDVPSLNETERELFNDILDQEFSYIGKGAQSYAFKSADGQYVLKFFKFKHLKPSIFIDLIPPIGSLKEYKEKKIERKHRLLNSVFDGYRLAYDVHAKETGLIFIHLNKSQNLNKIVTVRDKIGLKRTINLDEVPFILQEKVETTRTVMTELMNRNDIAGTEKKIKSILDLYMLEYSKGIYDRDHGVMHNTGFIGDQAVHLDVGKLTKDDRMKDPANYMPDLIWVVRKFDVWFKTHYPQNYAAIKNYMDHQVAEIMSEQQKAL